MTVIAPSNVSLTPLSHHAPQSLDRPVVSHIFSYLSVPEEVSARRVCFDFRAVVDDFRTPNASPRLPLSNTNARFDLPRMIHYLNDKHEQQWALPADCNAVFAAACRDHLKGTAEDLLAYRGPKGEQLDGNQALMDAVLFGRADIVDQLLEGDRCDLTVCGMDALMMAVRDNRMAIVERLLGDNRIDLGGVNHQLVLNYAVICSQLAMVDRLLNDPRVDPSVNENSAFREAAKVGDEAIVSRLLEDARVDPSTLDNYAIRIAAQKGHYEVVNRLLMDERVDPTANGCEASYLAVMNDNMGVFYRLARDPRVLMANLGTGLRTLALCSVALVPFALADWLQSRPSNGANGA